MTSSDFDRENLFDFNDHFFGLIALEKYDPKLIALVRQGWMKTRQFCREHLAPYILSEDRKNAADPNYISWDLLRLAGRHGQLSVYIPKFMGGTALASPFLICPNVEEEAAVDTGYSGMLGGHGLGLTALMMSLNMRILQQVAEKIAANENSERPYVIDCAITEPTAGTDVEEVELYPKARLFCQAKKVAGGVVLNGRKVFISTGHMASEHVVLMPFDLKDPINNYGGFLVPGNAKGFSLGRKERKMGHLISTVSELIFEDCFVPDENIIMSTLEFPEFKDRNQFQLILEMVLGITRTAVGAMGTGNARGSFERVLALAKKTTYRGRTLVNQQWAQAILTNMFMNAMMARSVYLETTFALLTNIESTLSRSIPSFMNTEFVKKLFNTAFYKKILHSNWLRKFMMGRILDTPLDNRARIQFMSSMAKVVGSDMAMENGHLAVEFLSRAGLRHDRGIEKGFRDAKLLQIFEGTNQLNRLNMFKHYIARHIPGVEVF